MIGSRILAIVLACSLLGAGLGCGHKITPWSVRADMSPELMTTGQTSGQQLNDFARGVDTNLRYAQDDLYRMMMWDQPNDIGTIPVPRADR